MELFLIRYRHVIRSGRFVKQEQLERWQAERKLVSGSKHRGRFCAGPRVSPPGIFWDCICKIMQASAFLAGKGKWFSMRLQWVLTQFNNGNAVPMRFSSKWLLW